MAAVERPAVEPQLDALRKQILDLPAGRRDFASDGGVHLVIVVKHGWRAQKLQRPNRGVSQNVGHRDPFPADSDLHEHHAHLRQACA